MTLRRAIKKLGLKQGDVLIVRDWQMCEAVQRIGRTINFDFEVPILIVPEKSDLRKVTKEDLQRALAVLS